MLVPGLLLNLVHHHTFRMLTQKDRPRLLIHLVIPLLVFVKEVRFRISLHGFLDHFRYSDFIFTLNAFKFLQPVPSRYELRFSILLVAFIRNTYLSLVKLLIRNSDNAHHSPFVVSGEPVLVQNILQRSI